MSCYDNHMSWGSAPWIYEWVVRTIGLGKRLTTGSIDSIDSIEAAYLLR